MEISRTTKTNLLKESSCSAVSISHNYCVSDEESFDCNFDQEARHITNTDAIFHAHSYSLTTQRSHFCLRIVRLLLVKFQPRSSHRSPIHLRQANLLVYETVVLERVLDVSPSQECLAQQRCVIPLIPDTCCRHDYNALDVGLLQDLASIGARFGQEARRRYLSRERAVGSADCVQSYNRCRR
jgi:hypothetical protein